MQVGFFFWPYTSELCETLAERADRYGYAMVGIADTPGNAMDPWVSAALVARASRRPCNLFFFVSKLVVIPHTHPRAVDVAVTPGGPRDPTRDRKSGR